MQEFLLSGKHFLGVERMIFVRKKVASILKLENWIIRHEAMKPAPFDESFNTVPVLCASLTSFKKNFGFRVSCPCSTFRCLFSVLQHTNKLSAVLSKEKKRQYYLIPLPTIPRFSIHLLPSNKATLPSDTCSCDWMLQYCFSHIAMFYLRLSLVRCPITVRGASM